MGSKYSLPDRIDKDTFIYVTDDVFTEQLWWVILYLYQKTIISVWQEVHCNKLLICFYIYRYTI